MRCSSWGRAGSVALLLLLAVGGWAVDEPPERVPLPLKLPKPAWGDGWEWRALHGDGPVLPDVEPYQVGRRPIPAVLEGTANLARGKPVTASVKAPFSGELSQVTDGDKEAVEGGCVELKPKRQWVQIDLGAAHPLSWLVVWHDHRKPVVIHDVIVQTSNDPEFKEGVTTLFNNDRDNSSQLGQGEDREYWETHEGRLIAAKDVGARYVRLYSYGSTADDPLNRYTEVEVFGLP